MNDAKFKELYDLCKEYCMKTLRKWTYNQQDAEDAFAEAISIYWIRFKQGKIKNHDNIKAYILKTALNTYRNKIKADKKVLDRAILDYDNVSILELDPQLHESKSGREMKIAFKKMSEDCQKMLTSKYVYGYRYEDIAEDMGRTSGNSVKVQTFRCAQYLLKTIEQLRNKVIEKR